MKSMIEIDPASPVPLYRQISEQLRRLIAIGALKQGDRLPTVRELAARVRVNRNTAARAIQRLENEGLVRTRVGQGTFVSEPVVRADRAKMEREMDRSIDRLLVEAQTSGMTLDELRARFVRRAALFERGAEEER
jgi:GntR family transcriptional regulator